MTSRKEDGSHLIVPLEKEMNSTRLSNSTDEGPLTPFPHPSEKILEKLVKLDHFPKSWGKNDKDIETVDG